MDLPSQSASLYVQRFRNSLWRRNCNDSYENRCVLIVRYMESRCVRNDLPDFKTDREHPDSNGERKPSVMVSPSRKTLFTVCRVKSRWIRAELI